MNPKEAFDLINSFLYKQAEKEGYPQSHSFMLGMAEAMLADILTGKTSFSDPVEDLIKRITDKQ